VRRAYGSARVKDVDVHGFAPFVAICPPRGGEFASARLRSALQYTAKPDTFKGFGKL
jgi:hypothetical protein